MKIDRSFIFDIDQDPKKSKTCWRLSSYWPNVLILTPLLRELKPMRSCALCKNLAAATGRATESAGLCPLNNCKIGLCNTNNRPTHIHRPQNWHKGR